MEKLIWESSHNYNFNQEEDFLNTILNDYGIEDVDLFLNPKKSDLLNPFLFKNMEEAVLTLHKALKTDKTIFIKADCDVDGITSGAIIYQFIKEIKPSVKIVYKHDYDKRHGLFYKDVKGEKDIGLIIVPDASVTLEESGKIRGDDNFIDTPILVLDHHEVNEDTDVISTVFINDTDGSYPNPSLSGAGVAYKFCQAYCQTYNISSAHYEQFIDLAAVGIVADSMSLKNPETRYIVVEGVKPKNQQNLFLNELQSLFEEDMKFGRTLTSIGWVLAPKINGAIRFGKKEEQDDLYRAVFGEEETIEYQPRRKKAEDPKPEIEKISLQKNMARVAKNIKSRQDTEVRKFSKLLDEKIEAENLLQNSVLFIDGTNVVNKNTVTGLIANKLASKYHRPVVLLKEFDSKEFGGSGRSYDKGGIEDFKMILNSLGFGEIGQGHESAFGVSIKKNNLEDIVKECNEKIPLDSLCTVHKVDWELDASKLKESYVTEVAENYTIWANDIPEPIFAIKNLHINASDIKGYGDNNGFIRFVYKNIPFIKKYCSKEDFPDMTCWTRRIMGENKKDLTLNLICQFVLNVWEDKVLPQVKILYFDSQENSEKVGVNDSKNSKKSTVKATTSVKTKEKKKEVKTKDEEKLVKSDKKKKKTFEEELEEEFGDLVF